MFVLLMILLTIFGFVLGSANPVFYWLLSVPVLGLVCAIIVVIVLILITRQGNRAAKKNRSRPFSNISDLEDPLRSKEDV
jgi:membrane protein DedA with SNARE-associated domain